MCNSRDFAPTAVQLAVSWAVKDIHLTLQGAEQGPKEIEDL